MRKNLMQIGAVAIVMAGAMTAQGAILAEYTFSPATYPPTYSSTAPNVMATPVTGGSQTVVGPSNNFYNSAPFMIVSRNGDTAANCYFQMTISAESGYELDLSGFSIDMAKGGGSDPRTYDIRTSVDGLSLTDPSLGSGTLTYARPGSNGVMPTFAFDLSAPKYQDLSSLTVRVYIYTPGVAQNIDVDNIVFSGAVSAVPEPSMMAVVPLAAAGLIRRRR